MTLSTVFLVLLVSYAICQLIITIANKKLNSNVADPSKSYGYLVAFSLIRTVVSINLVSLGALYLFILGLEKFSANAAQDAYATMSTLQDLNQTLVGATPEYSVLVAILIGLSLFFLGYRRSKLKVSKVVEAAKDKEFERLKQCYMNEELEEKEPDEEMKVILSGIDERQQNLEAIHQQLTELAESEITEETNAIIEAGNDTMSSIQDEINELHGMYISRDLYRRAEENVQIDKSQFAIPPAQTFGQKVQFFFMSRGLMKTLSSGNRFFLVLLTLLFIPSLLATQSNAISNQLETQVVKFQGLYLSLAEENHSPSIGSEESTQALSQEDEALIDELAYIYETNFTDTALPAQIASSSVSSAVKSHTVRDAILRASGQKVTATNPFSEVIDNDKYSKAARSHIRKQPATKLGQQFGRQLRARLATAGPDVWRSLRTGVSQFQIPASAADVRNVLMADAVTGDSSNQQLKRYMDNNKAGQLHRVRSAEIIDDLGKGNVAGASQRMSSSNFRWTQTQVDSFRSVARDIPDSDALARQVRYNRPSIDDVPEPHVRHARANQTLTRMRSMNLPSAKNLELFSESMHSYQGLFPPRAGAEFNTPRGKLMASIDPDKYSRTSADARRASTQAYGRAHSMRRLNGFSRIGGVLMGSYEGGDSLDIASFSWHVEQDNIIFNLTTQQGESLEIGPYPTEIARLALMYAADGRPTTVTMISAKPLHELKILLHPVLVDTALGCYAIKLDRFVEQFNDVEESHRYIVREAKDFFDASFAIQAYAYANSNFASNYLDDEEIEYLTSYSSQILSSGLQFDYDRAEQYLDSSLTPLSAKPEFFDDRLVAAMRTCESSSDTFENYQECLINRLSSQATSALQDASWFNTPEFQTWSGVREEATELASDLSSLNPDGKPQTWPLSFIDQVAFTSEPVFYQGNDFIDEPWTFPAQADVIQTNVALGVLQSEDDETKRILEYMTQFSLLQRMFRIAISGGFGEQGFDPASLIDLSEELANFKQPSYRTMRWNARKGGVERRAMQMITEYGSEVTHQGLSDKLQQCSVWMKGNIEWFGDQYIQYTNFSPISDKDQSEWTNQCDTADFIDATEGLDNELAKAIAESTLTRQLRLDYGVHVDDQQLEIGDVCPVM